MKSKKHQLFADNLITIEHQCICSKKYLHRQSLNRHQQNCKVYLDKLNDIQKNNVEKKDDEKDLMKQKIEILEEERQELRGQIAMLLEKFADQQPKPATSTVNQDNSHYKTLIENQSNNQNIENMTININAFGNENLDYLTDQIIVKCVGRIYNSIPVLIEKIHFDPEHPENHNIKITNRKLPYASVMTKSKKWKTVDKHDAIETMMDKSFNMLEMSYEGNKDEMSEHKQRRFEEFQKKFTNQDKETVKNTKKKVEIAILNGCE